MKKFIFALGLLAGGAYVAYAYGDKLIEEVKKLKKELEEEAKKAECEEECDCGCQEGEPCECDKESLTKEKVEKELAEIKEKAVKYAEKMLEDFKKKNGLNSNDIQELYDGKK